MCHVFETVDGPVVATKMLGARLAETLLRFASASCAAFSLSDGPPVTYQNSW